MRWTGHNHISGKYWSAIQRNARDRKSGAIEFNLSIEYASDLFDQQKGLCALTDLPLLLKVNEATNTDRTASLDRINNNFGYVVGNVQWIHKHVNKMKGAFDEEYFKYICQLITQKERKCVTSRQANQSSLVVEV